MKAGWASNPGPFCFSFILQQSSSKPQRLAKSKKNFSKGKRYSLFCRGISDEEKRFIHSHLTYFIF